MIPITPQPEPLTFDAQVRQLGLAAMNAHRGNWTNRSFWNRHRYWSNCINDMHILYMQTCAYLGVMVNRLVSLPIGVASVEHFIPKSIDRTLAYEWDNYRLVCSLANSERGDMEPFLDPFTILPGTFHLFLNSGFVVKNPNIKGLDDQAVYNTLKVINNNCFMDYRAKLFKSYKDNPSVLQQESPFIYAEAVRQGAIVL